MTYMYFEIHVYMCFNIQLEYKYWITGHVTSIIEQRILLEAATIFHLKTYNSKNGGINPTNFTEHNQVRLFIRAGK